RSTWLEPSANSIVARGSGCLRLIEFGDLVFEPLRVLWVEVVRRAVDDLQHTTIAGDGLSVFATLLMNVAEELPSVWDIRIALHEMAGGGLDLLQLAFVDGAKGSVDRLLQVAFPVIQGGGEVGRDRVADLAQFQALGCVALGLLGGEPLVLGRLVPRQATHLVFLAASARAAIVASRLGHRGRAPSVGRDASLYAALLADTRFHDLLLAVDRDLAEACRTEGCACGGPPARGALRPQTPRPAVPSRARARPALQLLLRRRRLPFAGDAAVAALPRAQGVCRDHRRADRHSAARRQRRAARALEPGRVRRPAHDRPLAQVVARHVHGDPVLEDCARRLHAAARRD